MLKQTCIILIVVCLFCIAQLSNAAMEATGNAAPLQSGENVLAAAIFNDSSGSSDMTLIVQLKADDKILIDEGSACKAIESKKNLPSDADPTGWTLPSFGDSTWQNAKYGVGYGDSDDNTEIGNTTTPSIYTRARFTIVSPGTIKKLTLGVDYDDAAVIWINGIEVARTPGSDVPAKPKWDSWSGVVSKQSHEASKKDPPGYEFVELKIQVASAIQPNGKVTVLWGSLKK